MFPLAAWDSGQGRAGQPCQFSTYFDNGRRSLAAAAWLILGRGLESLKKVAPDTSQGVGRDFKVLKVRPLLGGPSGDYAHGVGEFEPRQSALRAEGSPLRREQAALQRDGHVTAQTQGYRPGIGHV